MKRSLVAFCCVVLADGSCLHAADSSPLIQRVMAAADRNHDGRLSLEEYLPLDVQAAHHGKAHFEANDKNHDGLLDPAELDAALRKQTWHAILLEGVDACFNRLDTDNNGRLSLDEYRKISRMPNHAQQHFNNADANHDGSLSPVEFADHAYALLNKLSPSTHSQESKP